MPSKCFTLLIPLSCFKGFARSQSAHWLWRNQVISLTWVGVVLWSMWCIWVVSYGMRRGCLDDSNFAPMSWWEAVLSAPVWLRVLACEWWSEHCFTEIMKSWQPPWLRNSVNTPIMSNHRNWQNALRDRWDWLRCSSTHRGGFMLLGPAMRRLY